MSCGSGSAPVTPREVRAGPEKKKGFRDRAR